MDGVVPWPAAAAELYRKAGYWRGAPIGDCCDRFVAENAERSATVDGVRRISYRDPCPMVERRAGSLRLAALRPPSGAVAVFQLSGGSTGLPKVTRARTTTTSRVRCDSSECSGSSATESRWSRSR